MSPDPDSVDEPPPAERPYLSLPGGPSDDTGVPVDTAVSGLRPYLLTSGQQYQ